ncbi:hydroxymethylglutaryl-CoA reductase [Sulfuriroseicoccus oceanibius]|uniref:hydroxymethylglutaryl-CoA reductase (NADPH) n=1 Tax=Sulfuriroseicoccus oceanibius TaxID=2707525 RepID=A0A7T7JBG7_9BACT|nr:hydroxymethylglutaryl-CoA reductase [Sulfuriroseicoccus oceanibius]QQL44243.1 hydroxymethylglutaryl-CoA reductase [Sulfuriroseicoccus oceanibius]
MSGKRSLINHHMRQLLDQHSVDEFSQRLQLDTEDLPRALPATAKCTAGRADKLWTRLNAPEAVRETLLDPTTRDQIESYSGNIENCIGSVNVPVGVVGPLRVRGFFAHGDYPVPLATSEAALVASYHRGARLISAAGGARSVLLNQAVTRSPAFAFRDMIEAGRFIAWISEQFDHLCARANATTSHGELLDMSITAEGNHVYLNFEFSTGDASGQNMVTIATQHAFEYILEHSPIAPQEAYVEGNLSGDKKASAQAFTTVRGKKVSAEVIIPADLLEKHVHATPQQLVDYWRMSAVGGVLSGTIGVHGHFANGLAALYIATGQDAACVAESAVGVTRFETTDDGSLYAAVTLPGIMVGTVGGGTGLPSQRACLELMGLSGAGKSGALAEVTGALLLGGEISIIAALAAGHFTRAHRKLAR